MINANAKLVFVAWYFIWCKIRVCWPFLALAWTAWTFEVWHFVFRHKTCSFLGSTALRPLFHLDSCYTKLSLYFFLENFEPILIKKFLALKSRNRLEDAAQVTVYMTHICNPENFPLYGNWKIPNSHSGVEWQQNSKKQRKNWYKASDQGVKVRVLPFFQEL